MLILALITFLLFFYIAYRRPLLALSALATLLPTYLLRFTIFGLPSTILEVIIWGIVLGWAFPLLWKRRVGEDLIQLKNRLKKIKYPLALFFIASIISIFVAPDFIKALGLWRAFFLEPILVFLMILSVVKNRGDFEKIIFGLSVSAFYVSAIAVGQKIFGWPNPFLENAARASSVFPQPNMLGLYLAPIIILILGQAAQRKKTIAAFYLLLTAALSFIAITFAQSAGAIVGVIAGLIIFGLLYHKNFWKIFIIILLVTGYWLLVPNNLFLAAKNKLLFDTWSGFVRQNIWRESWAMLKDSWLWGAGIAGYATKILPYHASREWMDVFQYPHNIIFNFWSELGILGLGAFLWLLEKIGRMCYHLLKREKLFATTAIAAVATITIHGLVDVPYFKNDLSILFWIIYAMPFVI